MLFGAHSLRNQRCRFDISTARHFTLRGLRITLHLLSDYNSATDTRSSAADTVVCLSEESATRAEFWLLAEIITAFLAMFKRRRRHIGDASRRLVHINHTGQ